MYPRLSFLAVALAVCALSMTTASAAEKITNERVVKEGMLVSLDYTLKGSDGKEIESSKGREPLRYIHGKRMMIPGLERELTGMKVGGEKNVTVKPEDAYGLVNPQAFQEFPNDQVPPDQLKKIKVGVMVPLTGPNGQTFQFPVSQVKEKSIVVNLNHPLAGKTLVFNVKVVDVQPAPTPPPAQQAAPSTPPKPAAPTQPAKPADPAQTK